MCKNGPSECRVTCMPHHALAHEQSVLHACCMHSCPNILCTCENTNCTAHYGIAPLKTNFTSTSSTHAYAHPCTQNAYAHCTHMGTSQKTLYHRHEHNHRHRRRPTETLRNREGHRTTSNKSYTRSSRTQRFPPIRYFVMVPEEP